MCQQILQIYFLFAQLDSSVLTPRNSNETLQLNAAPHHDSSKPSMCWIFRKISALIITDNIRRCFCLLFHFRCFWFSFRLVSDYRAGNSKSLTGRWRIDEGLIVNCRWFMTNLFLKYSFRDSQNDFLQKRAKIWQNDSKRTSRLVFRFICDCDVLLCIGWGTIKMTCKKIFLFLID